MDIKCSIYMISACILALRPLASLSIIQGLLPMVIMTSSRAHNSTTSSIRAYEDEHVDNIMNDAPITMPR